MREKHSTEASDIEEFQKELVKQLKRDGLLSSSKSKVEITFLNDRMHVNGKVMTTDIANNYCEMFERHDIRKNNSTYIRVKPEYFEVKSKTSNGSYRHVTRGKWEKGADASSYTQPYAAPAQPKTAMVKPISFSTPTSFSKITSKYQTKANGKVHTGVDLLAPRHTNVAASAEGVVTTAKAKGDWGNLVTISHGNGYETRYANLEMIVVSKGDAVSVGQTCLLYTSPSPRD